MKNISYEMAVKVIESIYDSEIPCRVEWMYDGGFTWSIQNGDYPRLMIDDDTEGRIILAETPENMLLRHNPILAKDWIVRGNNYSFKEAVNELAEKICELYPESKFAQWFTV